MRSHSAPGAVDPGLMRCAKRSRREQATSAPPPSAMFNKRRLNPRRVSAAPLTRVAARGILVWASYLSYELSVLKDV
jgi:hypothetical protein